jgi:hypothetical protein
MAWYTYLAYFFAGVFLANGIPHFVHGISSRVLKKSVVLADVAARLW